jgi:hypothetical protein
MSNSVIAEEGQEQAPIRIVAVTHSPSTPTPEDTIRITATIVAENTLKSVRLIHCINDICKVPIEMDAVNVTTYTLELGPFDAGDIMKYYIVAEDVLGNITESAEYTLTIATTADIEPPESKPSAEKPMIPGFELLGALIPFIIVAIVYYRLCQAL